MKVKIKLLHAGARMPKKGTANSAAFDCYATSIKNLGDGRIKYGLGFALDPGNHKVTLKSRSSIHNTGLILSNGIGLGDPDYRGEYMAVFYHVLPHLPPYQIGDRIIQVEIEEAIEIEFEDVGFDSLTETDRGTGGFGSTGKN